MSKNKMNETVVQKTNSFPIIALLLLNLVAVLLTMGILLVRTQSLTKGAQEGGVISADRIGSIALDKGGNVIFDLMSIDAETNRPKVIKQVTMRQEEFLQGYSSMEGFVDKMIEAGIVTENAPSGTGGE